MLRRSRGRSGGLVGTMARTAVIAGTATAVSGSVASSQAAKAQAANAKQAEAVQSKEQLAALQADVAAMQAQSAAPAVGGSGDLLSQIQQLASLKDAGVLTDVEFEAAKAKLLGL